MQPGVGRLLASDVDPNKKIKAGKTHGASDAETPRVVTKETEDPKKMMGNFLSRKSFVKKNTSYTDRATTDVNEPAIASRLFPGDPSDAGIKKQLEAHWTTMNLHAGVNGSFTTLGIPDLVPGETVNVSGFQPFDGKVG